MELNTRQEKIIDFAEKNESFQMKDVLSMVRKDFDVDRMTILRDLSLLVQKNILTRTGKGRAVKYQLSAGAKLLKPIDVEKYFSVDFRDRKIEPFLNRKIFTVLNDGVFNVEETARLEKINGKYIESKRKLEKESPAILRREWERLIVELSWKSSVIEGNTYTLLETEALIKEHQIAKGKDKADAQMILNHKKALDFLLEHPKFFAVCKTDKIKKMHSLLVEELDIKNDFRSHGVGIGGTLYRPPADQEELAKATDKLSKTIERIKNPFAKALVVLLMISYIQPFEDGNKRTARIVANAILHAHDKAMLSYRDVDVLEYKKAILLFYEQNNISYFKELFLKQFEFAVENYFG